MSQTPSTLGGAYDGGVRRVFMFKGQEELWPKPPTKMRYRVRAGDVVEARARARRWQGWWLTSRNWGAGLIASVGITQLQLYGFSKLQNISNLGKIKIRAYTYTTLPVCPEPF